MRIIGVVEPLLNQLVKLMIIPDRVREGFFAKQCERSPDDLPIASLTVVGARPTNTSAYTQGPTAIWQNAAWLFEVVELSLL